MKTSRFIALVAATALLTIAATYDGSDSAEGNTQPLVGNIIETAAAEGSLTIFIAAAEEIGLDDMLAGPGEFTVFAPTDAAFGDLNDGNIALLMDTVPQLGDTLLGHVVPGRQTGDALERVDMLPTAGDGPVSIQITDDGEIIVGDSFVIVADIETTNGIIHIIDSIVTPTA